MYSKILAVVFALTLALSLVWHGNVAEAQIVKDGLVSWWSFDRSAIAADGTVEDGFGDNNGTVEGEPEIVEGKIGECLQFDGIDDFVTIPHSESLDIGGVEFSLEAWVKAPTQPAGLWLNTIYGKGGTNWKAGYLIAVRGSSDAALVGGCTVLVSRDGSGTETHTEKNIDDDEWHHIVGVFSRTPGEIRVYVDGKLEQSTGTDGTIDLSTAAEARIGRSSQQSNSADWFAGCVDEVRLYNKALSEVEIQQNYQVITAVSPTKKLGITWGRIKNSAR